MKIRLNGTLKGVIKGEGGKNISVTWEKGREFDDSKEPIPGDILIELKNKNPLVEMVADISDVKTQEISNEQLKSLINEIEIERNEKNALKIEFIEIQKKLEAAENELKKIKKEDIDKDPIGKAGDEFPCSCPVPGCEKGPFANKRALSTHMSKAHPELKKMDEPQE